MVGMAIVEAQLRSRHGAEIFDHHVFGICGDGDLSEGVSHEAASLAGHLGLGKLVLCYDDNHITIDGETELALTDDAAARFRAYGWDVHELGEVGEDLDALEAGVRAAMAVTDKPSLVIIRTTSAHRRPSPPTPPAAHGYAIFDDEIAATKAAMGMPADEAFHVPADVLEEYRALGAARLGGQREAWEGRVAAFAGDRSVLEAQLSGTGLPGWDDALPSFDVGDSDRHPQGVERGAPGPGAARSRSDRRRRRPHRQHRHRDQGRGRLLGGQPRRSADLLRRP